MSTQRTLIAYALMVTNLFKEMPTHAQTLHHATTGIMGEVVELFNAILTEDKKNKREELADAWFYFTKLKNIFGWSNEELMVYSDLPEMDGDGKPKVSSLGRMILWGGEMLDLTKKCWIYEKPLDEVIFKQAAANFYEALYSFMEEEDFEFEEIERANQEKLAIRYPDGCYTNEAAVARADKAEEGETQVAGNVGTES